MLLQLPSQVDCITLTLSNDKASSTDLLEAKQHLFRDSEVVRKITSILTQAASRQLDTAAPAILAWSILAQHFRSLSTTLKLQTGQLLTDVTPPGVIEALEQQDDIVEAIANICDEEDTVSFLAAAAVDHMRVHLNVISLVETFSQVGGSITDILIQLRARLTILDLLRLSLNITKYSPEVLATAIASVRGDELQMQHDNSAREVNALLSAAFLTDEEILVPSILQQSQMRFPFEMTPFIQLCDALTAGPFKSSDHGIVILQNLDNMQMFTHAMPHNFRSFEPAREDELPNCVRLTKDLFIFTSRRSPQNGALTKCDSLTDVATKFLPSLAIPAGTTGLIINDTRSPVVAWDFTYSALRYIVALMSTLLPGSSLSDASGHSTMNVETAAQTVSLMTSLIQAAVKGNPSLDRLSADNPASEWFTEFLKENVDEERDVLAVVLSLFDQELQRDSIASGDNSIHEFIVENLRFIHAVFPLAPARLWSFLRHSALMKDDNQSTSYLEMLAPTRPVTKCAAFLVAEVDVVNDLIEDVLIDSIARTARSRGSSRFSPSSSSSSINQPIPAQSNLLLAFTKALVQVFWDMDHCGTAADVGLIVLTTKLCQTFRKIVEYAYTTVGGKSKLQSAGKILSPVTDYLIQSLLAPDAKNVPPHAIVLQLNQRLSELNRKTRVTKFQLDHIESLCGLATTLLEVQMMLDRPKSTLQAQLLCSAEALCCIYIQSASCEAAVLRLLTQITKCASQRLDEPVSLLSYLDAASAEDFLQVLIGKIYHVSSSSHFSNIWDFLSSLIKYEQQWFGVFVLTGSMPLHSKIRKVKDTETTALKGIAEKPFLGFVVQKLCGLRTTSPMKAQVMLRFVLTALDHWHWARSEVLSEASFIDSLLDYLLKIATTSDQGGRKSAPQFDDLMTASLCMDILVLFVHHSQKLNNYQLAQKLLSKLSALHKLATDRLPYNSSLHSNLAKNFEDRFPGHTIANFERSELRDRQPGPDYLYDIEIAAKCLGFDSSWKGPDGNSGFAREMESANLNSSLVDVQFRLLRSWKRMILQLCNCPPTVLPPASTLINLISDTLRQRINDVNLPEPLCRLHNSDLLDTIFILAQRLLTLPVDGKDKNVPLVAAWQGLRGYFPDNGGVLSADDAEPARQYLKILFLTSQLCGNYSTNESKTSKSSKKAETNRAELLSSELQGELVEIFTQVVLKGILALTGRIHLESSPTHPSDLILIAGIMENLLSVPGASALFPQMALQVSNLAISPHLLSLLSWADRLALNRDPIYGEISLLFFYQISLIPSVTEQLAADGFLSQLNTAAVIRQLKLKTVVSPFDEPRRLYSMWVRGIIPLCLNFLHIIGPPIAGEVGAFINQFSNQIITVGQYLTKPSRSSDPRDHCITLEMATELRALAVIDQALERSREVSLENGANPGSIAGLCWDRDAVKDDLRDLTQGSSWRSGVYPSTDLEYKLFRLEPVQNTSKHRNRLEEKIQQELDIAFNHLDE